MSEFLQEIKKQPNALRNLVEAYSSENYQENIRKVAQSIKDSGKVIFSGMGSSYFAPYFVRDTISRFASVINIEAGELLHHNLGLINKNDPLILISQSGESIEVVKLVEIIGGDANIIGITNDLQSTLGKGSQKVLPLHSGSEKSISNKSYTNTLAILHLLSSFISGSGPKALDALKSIASQMDRFLSDKATSDTLKEVAGFLLPSDFIHFIGRGPQTASAYQAALIHMEGAKCHAHGFSSGAFRHGPMELCGPDHRAVIFAPRGKFYEKLTNLATDLISYGSKVVLLNHGDFKSEAPNFRSISISADNELSFTFLATLAFELMLVYVAESRGYTAGVFNVGQKITRKD